MGKSASATPYSVISAATTNPLVISGAAIRATLLQVTNSGAGWAYIKIYNKGSNPIPGTDTPILRIGIPPGGGTIAPFEFAVGTLGLAILITGGSADSDTTAVAAGQVLANFLI